MVWPSIFRDLSDQQRAAMAAKLRAEMPLPEGSDMREWPSRPAPQSYPDPMPMPEGSEPPLSDTERHLRDRLFDNPIPASIRLEDDSPPIDILSTLHTDKKTPTGGPMGREIAAQRRTEFGPRIDKTAEAGTGGSDKAGEPDDEKPAWRAPEYNRRAGAEPIGPSDKTWGKIGKSFMDSKFRRLFGGEITDPEEMKKVGPEVAFDLTMNAWGLGPTGKAVLGAGGAGGRRMTPAAVKAAADRAAKIGDATKNVDEIVAPAATKVPTKDEMAAALRDEMHRGIGSNQPPVEGTWTTPELVRVKPQKYRSMAEVPQIRDRPADEAIAMTVGDPHLIEGGIATGGKYIGGPRNIQSKRQLNKLRSDFDDFVAEDPRGWQWYDRYRGGLNETSGSNPAVNSMQAALHGQLSAGVDPVTETAMALRFNNMALRSGGVIPQGKGAAYGRPENRAALQRAIDKNDPAEMARGPKTSEYADRINPTGKTGGATGVNDFRYMRQWGFTNPDGSLPEAGKHPMGETIQKWMDYETARAVARANLANLGGRSDWTGEQLQAAPWVRQKAQDLVERAGKNADGTDKLSYEDAFKKANVTYADLLDKHTLAATYEQMPGAASGHLPGLQAADEATKRAFFEHPGSREGIADGGRDAYYGSLELEQAPGVAMQVRPTLNMEGVYKNSKGDLEFNPGEVARPLVGFKEGAAGKEIADDDKSIVKLVEAFRAMMNANEMGVAHQIFPDAKVMDVRAINAPLGSAVDVQLGGKKLTPQQLETLRTVTAKYGLPDVAHRGDALTIANFNRDVAPSGEDINKALKGGLSTEIEKVTGARPQRVGMDDIAHFWTDELKKGVGSGAMTDEMLKMLKGEPNIAKMLDRSVHIPTMARAKMERDVEFAAKLQDTVRVDIQNMREIIAQGPGWQERLAKARAEGKILLPSIVLPAFGLPVAFGLASGASEEDRRGGL